MDHQWRPRPPPIPGTICPTCAFSHFPFCPPHPNPPDQQPDHFIPRPAFDMYRPPDGFAADPRAWNMNPQFQPFREGFARPPYDYHRTGFVGDGDRNKRMRVDDNGVGDCSEDERRLKLIRDHGGMLSGQESSGFEDRNGFHKNAILNQEFPQSHEGPVQVHSQRGQPHKAPLAGYDYHSALQFQTKDSQFAHYHDQSSGIPMNNANMGHGFHLNHPRDLRQSSQDGYQGPGGVAHYSSPNLDDHTRGHMDAFRAFNGQPPLPASPPPPLPPAPAPHPPSEFNAYFSPPKPSTLFPVHVSPSQLSYPSRATDSRSIARPYSNNTPPMHASASFEDSQASRMLPKLSPEKQKVVDASNLFKQPNRATRPDHFVIILRGLPGSGKSYLAKFLRDLEVENGGGVPRIHSMDDYFMTEVEKADESDVSRSSTSARGKKRTMKKVMEYCYEPEMEEAYRSSMFKAFKKTLEEGVFTSVIVDDRNLRVADFAQFWAIAKRSGYEVYVLEATYKDPAGCAARNIHGFTQDDIEKMARQWEEAPSLYLQLDIKSLFHGDDLKETGIQEVDMDMDDGNSDDFPSGVEQRRPKQVHIAAIEGNDAPEDLNSSKDRERVYVEGDQPTEDVKELVRSKWSNDLDEDKAEKIKDFKGSTTALSGLIQAYSKDGKSVRWGDQVHSTGFSIGAAKKNAMSLEIGPGAGYNLKSNPLPEDGAGSIHGSGRSRRQNMFQEQLRAEHESFRAVFDSRRQRLHVEEE